MNYLQITPYVHLVVYPLERKQFSIEIVLSAGGSWFEAPNDRGRKHLMEHCIATRTKTMNLEELKKWQFRENILINAYTSPNVLAVTAQGHKSQFQKAFKVCAEMVFEPTFDQEVLDQEREIVLREINERRGDPEYITYYEAIDQTFTSDSIDRHQTLGSAEQVAQTTIQDMSRLHSQNLQNSHIIINLIGGGIDLEYAKKIILEFLSNQNPDTMSVETKLPINFAAKSQLLDFDYKTIVHPLAHAHSQLSIYIPFVQTFDNRPAVKLFEEMFLRFYGRLYHVLRDEKGYIYSMNYEWKRKTQVLEIEMSCEIKYIEPIVQTVKEVFGNFDKNFDFTKFQELQKVLAMKIEMSSDSSEVINHFTNTNLLQWGEFETFKDYEKRLNSVTTKDIQNMYTSIKNGLSKMQVVSMSKNPEIQKITINAD